MIRAVLDANVIVSAYPSEEGTLSDMLDHWRSRHFMLVTSEHIVREVERAWSKPYWERRFPSATARESVELLRGDSEMVELAIALSGIATHPEDDFILATALSANADMLVTGDRQLQKLERIGETIIVSPALFLAFLDDIFPG